jgi:hypothetical protein
MVPQDRAEAFGSRLVKEFRAVLVMVPPLLADLIRHVVASRVEASVFALSIVEEISDPTDIGPRLRALDPDIVIVGPAGAALLIDAAAIVPPRARVLTLSADLARILGPGKGESVAFTPEVLAGSLRNILRTI